MLDGFKKTSHSYWAAFELLLIIGEVSCCDDITNLFWRKGIFQFATIQQRKLYFLNPYMTTSITFLRKGNHLDLKYIDHDTRIYFNTNEHWTRTQDYISTTKKDKRTNNTIIQRNSAYIRNGAKAHLICQQDVVLL